MANFFPAILFLTLCVSTHVQARESQFFSKFAANADVKDSKTEAVTTRASPAEEQPAFLEKQAVTTRAGPAEEQPAFLEKQAQDAPAFVAEGENGYGLYGHETGRLPRADVATTTSFADEPYYNKEKNSNGLYEKDSFGNDEEIARDNKAMLRGSSYTTAAAEEENFGDAAEDSRNGNYFPAEEQRFADTRLQGRSYSTGVGASVNGQTNNYLTGGNRYTANGGQKFQQQGMSDTRFLENGKYWYGIDNEEKYNQNRYAESRNSAEFDTQGNYLPNAGRNNNKYGYSSYRNNNVNNNYEDNFAAENAKVMARGYDAVNNQYVFRGSKNTDEEFMP